MRYNGNLVLLFLGIDAQQPLRERHGLEIGPTHGLVGGATRSVGFENCFYGSHQSRLAWVTWPRPLPGRRMRFSPLREHRGCWGSSLPIASHSRLPDSSPVPEPQTRSYHRSSALLLARRTAGGGPPSERK